MDARALTPAQCVLLTVHLASEANISALHSFTPVRNDALDPELVLRILLTYLPEAVDPKEYANYVEEVASRLYVNIDREDVEVNTASVKDISEEQAKKQVKKLHLLQIQPPSFPPHAPDDLLTRFLCHRAYRIDSETGLLNLLPTLIEPFLDRNDFIRVWYISMVLPLLRLQCEYYPEDVSKARSLVDFEQMTGMEGVDFLMKNASQHEHRHGTTVDSTADIDVARDIKGLVGPWMYGHTERKRRKLEYTADARTGISDVETVTRKVRKISLTGVSQEDLTDHDWEYMYRWILTSASEDFGLVAQAVEGWDGPSDVDLGGFDHESIGYLDDDVRSKLELRYAQAAFASCYAAQADTEKTIREAHSILARLAELLDFIPPPDLATSVDALPKIERHAKRLDDSGTDLLPENLLRPEHPLTSPRLATYMLLQMMVYSAYQFSGLEWPMSIINVARLHFYADAHEQLEVLRKLLKQLSKATSARDETTWLANRAKLLWLWNWGIESDAEDGDDGAGVLGKISKEDFEEEMLKVFTDTTCKFQGFHYTRYISLATNIVHHVSFVCIETYVCPVDEIDPVQNTDALAGIEEKNLSFPFVVTEGDQQRVEGGVVTDRI